MATDIRKYDYPFIVEKSKITRLVTIIQENICADSIPYRQKFTVNILRGGHHEAESLDKIFELVNPQRNPIINFEIDFATPKDKPESHVTIDFTEQPTTFILVMIVSDNIRWMTQIFSLIEEQIERMYQFHNPIAVKIISNPGVFVVFCLMMLFMIGTNVFPQIIRPSAGESNYWLTRGDIDELDKTLKSKDTLTNEDLLNVFTRQIRNVVDKELHQKSILMMLSDWRLILISIPIIIIIVSLIYLIINCYPSAVFLWGDMEHWYQTMINRRKAIWNVVIFALLFGIIGNLFVFGITDFVRP